MWFALGFLAGTVTATATFLAMRYRAGRSRKILPPPTITVSERDYTDAIRAIEREWGITV